MTIDVKLPQRNKISPMKTAAIEKILKKSLQIVEKPISELKPSPHNARRHGEKQISQLMASIRKFGFNSIVLIDAEGVILAGHGRVEAAKRLGMDRVPTVMIDHLTPEEARAFIIADNKIAQNSDWDEDLLASELNFLNEKTIELNLDWDIEICGFESAEIDFLIDGPPKKKPKTDPDDKVAAPAGLAVSRLGDIWVLGNHRLICGDALDMSTYASLLGREKAQLIVTDAPYNVPIAGHVGGSGKVQHREFVQASGEMSDPEFTRFLLTAFDCMASFSQDGAVAFLFMDWRHTRNLMDAADAVFSKQLNLCIWDKGSGGMGTFYRSAHELIFAYKVGSAPHINNFGLGERGRYRTNIWRAPGANSFKTGRMEELELHPTVKPVSLISDAVRDCSKRGDIVLDGFCGSGTILIAAEKTGRRARAIELDPLYVDTAVRRWQKRFGKEAKLQETGQTFADVERDRATPLASEAGTQNTKELSDDIR